MLGFRKKILLSDIVLFLIFISLLFPFVERTVGNIVQQSLDQRAEELISRIRKEPGIQAIMEYLKKENAYIFFRITLFDRNGDILYDTRIPNEELLASEASQEIERPEIVEALKYGRGYSNRYSKVFRQTIAYVALSFEAEGLEYILRIGLPFTEIRVLTHDFEIGFLTLGVIILLLYSVMTWAIMHRLSLPIQQIIKAIEPYQAGRREYLPRIEIGREIQEGDEFGKLAYTLNSLNMRTQKQFENLVRQKNETEAILESLGEGVVAVDMEGNITFANRVAKKMLRVSEDVLNQKFSEIKTQRIHLAQKCRELIQTVLESAEIVVQTFTIEEPQRFYFDLIAAPLAQHSGMILVLQDKTSDYRILEMGKDFIANASHELRTPITIIRGFAETLNDLPNLSQEMLKEITEKIVRTCLRLDSLVKSLLTLADIENLSIESFQPSDVVALCENCIHLIETAHPNVQVSLKKSVESAPVFADADLLEMAIMNLLQNAIKYSPAPAKIEVIIDVDHPTLSLSVKDRGIGIPESDLPHIFERFYTVDKARSRKFGGTGLGLSIVKTIVQRHGGSIDVTSQLGHGSTFRVILPVAKDLVESGS